MGIKPSPFRKSIDGKPIVIDQNARIRRHNDWLGNRGLREIIRGPIIRQEGSELVLDDEGESSGHIGVDDIELNPNAKSIDGTEEKSIHKGSRVRVKPGRELRDEQGDELEDYKEGLVEDAGIQAFDSNPNRIGRITIRVPRGQLMDHPASYDEIENTPEEMERAEIQDTQDEDWHKENSKSIQNGHPPFCPGQEVEMQDVEGNILGAGIIHGSYDTEITPEQQRYNPLVNEDYVRYGQEHHPERIIDSDRHRAIRPEFEGNTKAIQKTSSRFAVDPSIKKEADGSWRVNPQAKGIMPKHPYEGSGLANAREGYQKLVNKGDKIDFGDYQRTYRGVVSRDQEYMEEGDYLPGAIHYLDEDTGNEEVYHPHVSPTPHTTYPSTHTKAVKDPNEYNPPPLKRETSVNPNTVPENLGPIQEGEEVIIGKGPYREINKDTPMRGVVNSEETPHAVYTRIERAPGDYIWAFPHEVRRGPMKSLKALRMIYRAKRLGKAVSSYEPDELKQSASGDFGLASAQGVTDENGVWTPTWQIHEGMRQFDAHKRDQIVPPAGDPEETKRLGKAITDEDSEHYRNMSREWAPDDQAAHIRQREEDLQYSLPENQEQRDNQLRRGYTNDIEQHGRILADMGLKPHYGVKCSPFRKKAMSSLSETSGGALVKPAKQKGNFSDLSKRPEDNDLSHLTRQERIEAYIPPITRPSAKVRAQEARYQRGEELRRDRNEGEIREFMAKLEDNHKKQVELENAPTNRPASPPVEVDPNAPTNRPQKSLPNQQDKAGHFSGNKVDVLGRHRCYREGKLVPCSQVNPGQQQSAAQEQGTKPGEKQTAPSEEDPMLEQQQAEQEAMSNDPAMMQQSLIQNMMAPFGDSTNELISRMGEDAWFSIPEEEQASLEETWTLAKAVKQKVNSFFATRNMTRDMGIEERLDSNQVKIAEEMARTAEATINWNEEGVPISELLPLGSLSYLGYSTNPNPFGVIKKARDLIGVANRSTELADVGENFIGLLTQEVKKASDLDWFFALFGAALDQIQNPILALKAATGLTGPTMIVTGDVRVIKVDDPEKFEAILHQAKQGQIQPGVNQKSLKGIESGHPVPKRGDRVRVTRPNLETLEGRARIIGGRGTSDPGIMLQEHEGEGVCSEGCLGDIIEPIDREYIPEKSLMVKKVKSSPFRKKALFKPGDRVRTGTNDGEGQVVDVTNVNRRKDTHPVKVRQTIQVGDLSMNFEEPFTEDEIEHVKSIRKKGIHMGPAYGEEGYFGDEIEPIKSLGKKTISDRSKRPAVGDRVKVTRSQGQQLLGSPRHGEVVPALAPDEDIVVMENSEDGQHYTGAFYYPDENDVDIKTLPKPDPLKGKSENIKEEERLKQKADQVEKSSKKKQGKKSFGVKGKYDDLQGIQEGEDVTVDLPSHNENAAPPFRGTISRFTDQGNIVFEDTQGTEHSQPAGRVRRLRPKKKSLMISPFRKALPREETHNKEREQARKQGKLKRDEHAQKMKERAIFLQQQNQQNQQVGQKDLPNQDEKTSKRKLRLRENRRGKTPSIQQEQVSQGTDYVDNRSDVAKRADAELEQYWDDLTNQQVVDPNDPSKTI